VRSGGADRADVGLADPADRHDALGRKFLPRLLQERERRAHGGGLGRRCKDGTERDDVRASLYDPTGPQQVVIAGHTDQCVREPGPCLCNIAVITAEVHAVGIEFLRERDIVVHNEQRPVLTREGLDRASLSAALLRRRNLAAVLHERDACRQRGAQPNQHRIEVRHGNIRRQQVDALDPTCQRRTVS